jgi:hypothetical protein
VARKRRDYLFLVVVDMGQGEDFGDILDDLSASNLMPERPEPDWSGAFGHYGALQYHAILSRSR